VADLLADGALVAPLRQDSVTDRAYFIVRSAAVRSRRDVDDFIAWLIAESAALVRIMDKHKRNRRHARPS
jgi:hypothetical protein